MNDTTKTAKAELQQEALETAKTALRMMRDMAETALNRADTKAELHRAHRQLGTAIEALNAIRAARKAD